VHKSAPVPDAPQWAILPAVPAYEIRIATEATLGEGLQMLARWLRQRAARQRQPPPDIGPTVADLVGGLVHNLSDKVNAAPTAGNHPANEAVVCDAPVDSAGGLRPWPTQDRRDRPDHRRRQAAVLKEEEQGTMRSDFTQPISMVRPAEELSELAHKINVEHGRAETSLQAGLEHARRAGELLNRAKEKCQHGQWLSWLKANVRCAERTAQAYMRVARRWEELVEANPQGLADLTFEDGLNLLSQPQELLAQDSPDMPVELPSQEPLGQPQGLPLPPDIRLPAANPPHVADVSFHQAHNLLKDQRETPIGNTDQLHQLQQPEANPHPATDATPKEESELVAQPREPQCSEMGEPTQADAEQGEEREQPNAAGTDPTPLEEEAPMTDAATQPAAETDAEEPPELNDEFLAQLALPPKGPDEPLEEYEEIKEDHVRYVKDKIASTRQFVILHTKVMRLQDEAGNQWAKADALETKLKAAWKDYDTRLLAAIKKALPGEYADFIRYCLKQRKQKNRTLPHDESEINSSHPSDHEDHDDHGTLDAQAAAAPRPDDRSAGDRSTEPAPP
jgi:hypothetical protein